jgi:hypothetical protein
MEVADHQLKASCIDTLRIADAWVMPRVTTGNAMVPCVAKVGIVGIVRPLDARTVANAWSPSSCPETANVRCDRELHVLHANG